MGMNQLIPDRPANPQDAYRGPVALLKEAYEETESLGSTTILLAVLDNSTRVHGKLHPMVAVLTIGDCEMLMMRRRSAQPSKANEVMSEMFQVLYGSGLMVFHTEMQRIDGHSQTPLQLARVDDRVDPEFDEELALEVIERGSAVHCVSAYEGDILAQLACESIDGWLGLLRSDRSGRWFTGLSQIARTWVATQPVLLSHLARRLVDEAHAKSEAPEGWVKPWVGLYGLPDTPIGLGGKMDDTSVVVGEVVEWTKAHSEVWAQVGCAPLSPMVKDVLQGGSLQP
ncbi:PPM-type phosphatase domain-containing protein [Durusdinium trenchii]|uniref:PPM-type phosphatase domain-containing protein n=1 Tax=Durusdinium trenchii TaxID=1381693 RepID=A0ABP0JN53_9DINO